VTHGAWLRARIYPERSAVSPNGKLLATFILDARPHSAWESYFAVSKLPWLHALAAWETVGTWTTGAHFESDRDLLLAGGCVGSLPDHGSYPGDVTFAPVDTRWIRARLFRELRTGWTEVSEGEASRAGLPAPIETSPGAVVLTRQSPQKGDGRTLVLVSLRERQREYYVMREGHPTALTEVVSAEWGPDGTILAATGSGHLRMIGPEDDTLWTYDMNRVDPEPRAAPPWATSW